MVRTIALVCFLAGCGRLNFDLVGDDTLDDGGLRDDGSGTGSDSSSDSGPNAIANGQASTVTDVFGPVTLTLPDPTAAGSLLVIAFGTNGTSSLVVPAGWTVATQGSTNGGCWAGIMYMANNPGGITSVMFSQPAGLPTVAQLTEWKGVATASALDAIGTAGAQNPSTMQTVMTATATTEANELAIDVFCEDANLPTYVPGAGWEKLGSFSNDASSPSITTNYRFVPTPGVVAETVTSSTSSKYAAAIATFRAL